MINETSSKNIPKILSLIFFISFGMSFFFIEIGFAFKPYMLAVIAIFIYLVSQALKNNIKIHRPLTYEYIFILFLLMVAVSISYSLYPERSFRLSANAALIAFCYIVLRTFFLNFLNLIDLKQSICRAGIVVAIASLAFYAIGASNLDFNFTGNGIDSYGLTVDRGTPRLAGVVTTDPNLTAAFLSIFFFVLLTTKGKLLSKLLVSLTIILTFSRGAYLAVGLSLLLYIIANMRRFLTMRTLGVAAIITFISIVGLGVLNNITGINATELAVGRVDEASVDGGSGRIDIWDKALGAFYGSPLVGIGANSSLQYNIDNFQEHHYVHNTYLEVLIELGVVGAIVYLLLIVLLFYASIKCYSNREQAPLLVLIALLVQMSFLSMMTNEAFMVIILLLTTSMHSIRGTIDSNNKRNALRRVR